MVASCHKYWMLSCLKPQNQQPTHKTTCINLQGWIQNCLRHLCIHLKSNTNSWFMDWLQDAFEFLNFKTFTIKWLTTNFSWTCLTQAALWKAMSMHLSVVVVYHKQCRAPSQPQFQLNCRLIMNTLHTLQQPWTTTIN